LIAPNNEQKNAGPDLIYTEVFKVRNGDVAAVSISAGTDGDRGQIAVVGRRGR
jgi:hypothetical protein